MVLPNIAAIKRAGFKQNIFEIMILLYFPGGQYIPPIHNIDILYIVKSPYALYGTHT